MALKISGTTVVSDARALWNIAAADQTTIDTLRTAGLGGGSGLFNTNISYAVGYNVTTSFANAYTAATTAGKRYIVHSIHVTNTADATSNISGQIGGTTYSNISFANTVPVPAASSVELLKKPKILQPGDYIQLTEDGSDLWAVITVEDSTDTKYFGSGIDLTSANAYTDLYTMTANSVLESILLSNDDSSTLDVKAIVVWTDGANAIQSYLAYNMIIPNDATVEILEQPKFIPSGHKIRVLANQANRLEAIIAGKTV